MAIRTDVPAAGGSVSLDGDYAPHRVDSYGKLWISGSYPEDQASANLDPVAVAGAKRLVVPVNSSGADGDYEPLTMSVGKLWVTGTYPEDTASADLDPVMVMGAKRLAVPANSSSTDGDYEPLQMDAGKLWVKPLGNFVTVTTTITRPANTAAYAAADNVGSTDAGGYTFTNCARISGGSGIITDMHAYWIDLAATKLQGELWIMDSSFTATADNSPITLSDTEALTLVAIIPFTMFAGPSGDMAHVQNLSIGFTTVGSANLRFAVVARNAATPAANSSTLTFRLKILQID
jgi:hypothetical protein